MQELMTVEIAKTVPRLYEQDGADDPIVHVRYFSCVNGWDWWLLEFDGTDEAFGLVEGYDDELGYFSIKEMEELNRQMGFAGDGVPVAAFPRDGPRHPRTPARRGDVSPRNPVYCSLRGDGGVGDTGCRMPKDKRYAVSNPHVAWSGTPLRLKAGGDL